MALQTPIFTYENAKERQQQTYNLRLTNWGNVSATADASSLGFNIRDSIYGVAIAATSDVDRCAIQYTAGKVFPSAEGQPTFSYALSVRSPIFFQVPGPIDIRAAATLSGVSTDAPDILYRWGTQFLQDQNPTATDFDEFQYAPAPRLDLILYLKPPVLAPSSRAPKVFRFETLNNAGTQQAMRIPCSGRSRIDIGVRPTGTLTGGAMIVDGLDASWSSTDGDPPIEKNYGTVTGLDAASGDNGDIQLNDIAVDFLTIYTTATGGAGTFIFNIHMYD
jgi:hypothetical protein